MSATTPARLVWRELAASGLLGRFLLLCLGVWLHAADSLVTATLMPSVVADIGGTIYVSWSISLYQIGAIVAGALAARIGRRAGLRGTMMLGGASYFAGCVAAAAAPDMAVFLVGRLIQGLGGGMLLSLSYVAIEKMFPERYWSALMAVVAAIWAGASFGGPLIGGLFAEYASWRAAFWSFAAQAAVLLALGRRLPADRGSASGQSRGDLRSLAWLTAGTLLISWAGTLGGLLAACAAAVAGAAVLWVAAFVDGRSASPLMPRAVVRPWRPAGAGLLMVLGLSLGTCAFWTYGPLILQVGFGVDPLVAGVIMAGEAVAWSLATIFLAGVAGQSDRWPIRVGCLIVAVGAGSLAASVPAGSLSLVAVGVVLQGVGMGLAWPPLVRRIVVLGDPTERDLSAAAPSVVQRIGYAAGAALCGLVANAAGVADGMAPATAIGAAPFVFASAIPALLLAVAAIPRFTGAALRSPGG